jgi:hypothetical protein
MRKYSYEYENSPTDQCSWNGIYISIAACFIYNLTFLLKEDENIASGI